MTPSAPHARAPHRRGGRRRAAMAAAVAGLTLLSLGVAAAPAEAAPEQRPHSGAWDGFDLYVADYVRGMNGVYVTTFSHDAQYCIPVSKGWNSIPLQHWTTAGSGAKLVMVNNCRQRFFHPRSWIAKPGEHWTLESGGPRQVFPAR
jgi:hypothetical protein